MRFADNCPSGSQKSHLCLQSTRLEITLRWRSGNDSAPEEDSGVRGSAPADLKKCKACAKLLKELEADDQLLRDLRGSVELYQQFATEPKPYHTSK